MLSTLRFLWSHPLTRRQRLATFSRYLRWQVGCRVLPYPVLVPFGENAHLVVERSMTGATGNVYVGLHEFEDMAFVLHFLRPTDLFVDVGANVGSYTILASKTVGARTICIEPIPQTFDRLRRNIVCNELQDRVTALQCVVGAAPGHIRFSADRDTMNQVVTDDYPGKSLMIEVQTLENLLKAHSGAMWKIDVEGFESQVLSGALDSLMNLTLNAVLLETNDQTVTQTMLNAGFQPARYAPFERQLSRGSADSAQAATTGNTLWVRDFDFVQQRCASSPTRRFVGVNF